MYAFLFIWCPWDFGGICDDLGIKLYFYCLEIFHDHNITNSRDLSFREKGGNVSPKLPKGPRANGDNL